MFHTQVFGHLPFERANVRSVVRQPSTIENVVEACKQLVAIAQIRTTDVKRFREKLGAAGHKRSSVSEPG
jgi:hypothetical protein